MKLLTIGGATQDILIRYNNPEMVHMCMAHQTQSFLLLAEGKKIDIDQLHYLSGGGATNSAVFFSRYGFDSCAFFKVGNDDRATFILKELEHEGVNCSFVVHSTDIPTAISFIIPAPSGDRTVLCYRGATQTLTKDDLPLEQIQKADQLYITSLSGPSSHLLPEIATFARKHKVPIATNPGTSQLIAGADHLQEALPNIDILILNVEEAGMLMTSLKREQCAFDKKQFFEEILSRGPKIVAVTNGAEGVYVATHNGLLFHPSLGVEVVCTLGAGDAFGSCFVASLLENYSVEESLVRGIINACSVIGLYGAKAGLLTKNELDKRFKNVGLQKISKR